MILISIINRLHRIYHLLVFFLLSLRTETFILAIASGGMPPLVAIPSTTNATLVT